ncbi:MAG: hypothetical protein QG570_283 [Patescibacteria group bacterium]|jgi:hypothetical protein|nr:hypothetical protein [Patescibacteria group bacterium]
MGVLPIENCKEVYGNVPSKSGALNALMMLVLMIE